MIFTETKLKGAYIIDLEKKEDERGFFARVFDQETLSRLGLESEIVQASISNNTKKYTLRGMHYQTPPYEEIKFVRVTRGSVYYVIVDLRPDSLTYMKHFGVNLTADNCTTLYIPKGLASGFITMEDNTEVFYQMSQSFHPESARGVRWSDPAFRIKWPFEPKVISQKDKSYPNYEK